MLDFRSSLVVQLTVEERIQPGQHGIAIKNQRRIDDTKRVETLTVPKLLRRVGGVEFVAHGLTAVVFPWVTEFAATRERISTTTSR